MRQSNLVVLAGGRASVVRLLTSIVCSAALAIAFLQSAGAQSQTATISLSPQDTFINVDTITNSAATTLNLYTWPDYQPANAILMKFNLSSLPSGAVVQQAVLRMSLVQADTTSSAYTITAHKMVSRNPNIAAATGVTADGGTAWTASGCCYNGIPLAQSDISAPYATVSVGTSTGAYSWPITSLVREWIADPSSNYGLLLNADATKPKDTFRYFASMEHPNAALRPVLQITYSASDVTPPAVSMTSPSGGAALSGMAVLSATASDQSGVAGVQFLLDGNAIGQEVTSTPYAMNLSTTGVADGTHALAARARDVANNTRTSSAVTVTVSNGAIVLSPADTTLNVNATNYSTATTLATYTWPNRSIANAIVLKFAIPAMPPGTVIQSATLQMALVESDASSDPTYTVTAHKILGKNVVVASASGYSVNGVSNWTPSTCCYGATPMAQSDISTAYDQQAIDKAAGFKTWTLTNLVQEWVTNPASNFGVLLNSDASKLKDRYRYFASMEHPNASLRPSLRIQYAAGTGTPPPTSSTNPPSGVDSTPPTVTMTTPAAGATVSGTSVSVTAAASDNVGVVGVQFKLDGANLDSEKTTPPYYVGWNTTGGSGTHTLAAVARDAAGNQRWSSTITVTISNGATPPPATPPPSNPATPPPPPPVTVDTTPPTVSMTGPAAGATVSGTAVSVTASASDNVGVVGVQFKLDGANLDSEKTTPPYYVGWNTTGGTGTHTLAAVARDAAGNQRWSSTITVTISSVAAPPPPPPPPPPTTPPPSSGGGIASRYPGDTGIENDPAVIFVEKFEEAALSDVFPRWGDVKNGGSMVRVSDVPAGSPGRYALSIPWVGGGVNSGGHLYKVLSPAVNDTLYVRYYVKYPSSGNFHHSGIWMGGNNPMSAWPDPNSGSKPTGSDRFIAAAEQNNNVTHAFDHYDYWMNMRPDAGGAYWGDLLLNNQAIQAPRNQWACVEQMVKLNNPVSASNGEHAIWLNGVKISHLGQGFPTGSWSGGLFTQGAGSTPFPGFQWRNSTALNINWIWLQNYSPDDAPGFSSTIMYDHVVVATSYIGCLG